MADAVRLLLACDPGILDLPRNGAIGDYTFLIVAHEQSADRIVETMSGGRADILLLDADRDNFEAYALTKRVTGDAKDATVILLSSRTEPDALRSAMLSGAEEYLIKPLQSAAVHEALVSVWEIRQQKRQVSRTSEVKPEPAREKGQLIGVVSGKGGIGKTTISVNLALTLIRDTKKSVALVGLESGDATVLLNLHARASLVELAAQPFDNELLEQYGVVHSSGLTYFTANTGTGVASERFVAADAAKRVLGMLQATRDFVIVDFPHLIDQRELHMAELLDQVLILSSSWDLLVLRNTKHFLDVLPESCRERARIVLNRSDRSDMIQMDDIKRALQREVAMAIQNDSRLAPAAVNTGNPFVLTNPQAPISQDLAALARLVSGGAESGKAEPTSGKRKFLFFS